MALSNITALTNAQMWDAARKLSPTFASHTSEGTSELFTEKGFDALTRSDVNAINEYFELSLRIGFQALTVSKARNILENKGLVETYHTMNGGYMQRMSVNSIKPITPGYNNLQDGDVRSPFITRKPEVGERFFQRNFDYQSLVTIQQYNVKQIFVSEYGMSSFVAGIMTGLENGYVIQRYENTMELVNAALNSTKFPLQSTQVYTVGGWYEGEATNAQVISLLKLMKNIKTNIETKPQSSAFNAAKFATRWEVDDTVVLVRAGVKTDIESINKLNAPGFGTDIPFDNVVEVDNFGGLKPYIMGDYDDIAVSDVVVTGGGDGTASNPLVFTITLAGTHYEGVALNMTDSTNQVTWSATATPVEGQDGVYVYTTGTTTSPAVNITVNYAHAYPSGSKIYVYPVYDENFGSVVEGKWSRTEGGAEDPTIDNDDVMYEDPNADVLVMVCQKGLLFEDIQNEYSVQPIYNPRTLCTNYWANQPQTGLAFDPYYGCVVIKK